MVASSALACPAVPCLNCSVPLRSKKEFCSEVCIPIVSALCSQFSGPDYKQCQQGIVRTCVQTDPNVCRAVSIPVGPTGPTGPAGPQGAQGNVGPSGVP